MKTEEYRQIEDLLERFFEGQTSNEEERTLYDFFTRADVPSHLESYKEVFGYFEKSIAGEFWEAPELSITSKAPSSSERRFRWTIILAVAASLLVLLVNTFFIGRENSFNPYEGSFIVRNGERITDPQKIRAEIVRVEAQQEWMDQLIREMDRKECVSDIAGRRAEEGYLRLMNRLSEDNLRDEVRQMLESDE